MSRLWGEGARRAGMVAALWLAAGAIPHLVRFLARYVVAGDDQGLVGWFSLVAVFGWALAGVDLLAQGAVAGKRTRASAVGLTVMFWWILALPFSALFGIEGILAAFVLLPALVLWFPAALAFVIRARRDLRRSRRWSRGPVSLLLAVTWFVLPEFVLAVLAGGNTRVMLLLIALDGAAVGGLSLLGFAWDRRRATRPHSQVVMA